MKIDVVKRGKNIGWGGSRIGGRGRYMEETSTSQGFHSFRLNIYSVGYCKCLKFTGLLNLLIENTCQKLDVDKMTQIIHTHTYRKHITGVTYCRFTAVSEQTV